MPSAFAARHFSGGRIEDQRRSRWLARLQSRVTWNRSLRRNLPATLSAQIRGKAIRRNDVSQLPDPTPPRKAVRRLVIGRFISLTGTIAAGTALSYSMFKQTGSAAWVAATMLATFGIIGLLGPIAGAIGDRYDRRLVMIIGESAAAAFWGAMAFVTDMPALLLSLAFLASVSEAPFASAAGAAIPNLAGKDNLSWANSLIAVGRDTPV